MIHTVHSDRFDVFSLGSRTSNQPHPGVARSRTSVVVVVVHPPCCSADLPPSERLDMQPPTSHAICLPRAYRRLLHAVFHSRPTVREGILRAHLQSVNVI
ncbi:hypothetical protein NUW54_g11544 [Trametes sanguinea]|uniref:Uncharacterized protein n=1 Tax=Trametes sanguinea TaxID=158606 RepID=A0ACC1NCK2_9APHY|nr:hypothetical protein NUW54_g11544 [Trametes sanguinea]